MLRCLGSRIGNDRFNFPLVGFKALVEAFHLSRPRQHIIGFSSCVDTTDQIAQYSFHSSRCFLIMQRLERKRILSLLDPNAARVLHDI